MRSTSAYQAYDRWLQSQTRPSRGHVCLGCEMKDNQISRLQDSKDISSGMMHRALETCVESMDVCSEQFSSLQSELNNIPSWKVFVP